MNKYKRTEGYWVYAHIIPQKGVYIGMSKQQPYQRWRPKYYKSTALAPYIEQYGWDNIEHRVLIDNLTKAQAEKVEDYFITQITEEGFCINKQGSGGYWRDNRKEYDKAYREAHREERLEQNKSYREANREQILEQNKAYYETNRDKILEQQKAYNKQRYSTPEGKIYSRVAAYNRRHPDKAIENPMEARTKYLETGYIPSYIKNNDLI